MASKDSMTKLTKQEIIGVGTGNTIRFTCPTCSAKNSMVFSSPKDFFKEKRDATCKGCKARFSVATPSAMPGR